MDVFESLPAIRLTPESSAKVEAVVAREYFATLFLNGQEMATFLCSPANLDHLAAGFLFSEGLINAGSDIGDIVVDEKLGVIRVQAKSAPEDARYKSPRLITSGCGGAADFYSVQDAALPKIESGLKINARDIFAMVKAFQHFSPAYLATHGTHSAALCNTSGDIMVFGEDVGRHNAVDKLFGKCLLEDIPTGDRIILTSGRISFEILQKVTRRNVPVIVSISAPMSLGIQMAEKLGVTLVGSARGQSMYLFSHPERIVGLPGTNHQD